jgi:hypothetical protein
VVGVADGVVVEVVGAVVVDDVAADFVVSEGRNNQDGAVACSVGDGAGVACCTEAPLVPTFFCF